MKIKILLIIFILTNTISIQSKVQNIFFKITARSGLSLRKNADKNSERIEVLPYSSRVLLIKESNKVETINTKKGKWVQISWLDFKGWVFDYYLKKVSPNDPVIKYTIYCSNLPVNNLNSITKAKNKFRTIFKNRPESYEHGFRIFRDFYNKVKLKFNVEFEKIRFADFLNIDLIKEIDPENISAKQIKILKTRYQFDIKDIPKGIELLKKLKTYSINGLRATNCEGYSELEENYNFFYKDVLQGFKGPLVNYFSILAKYDNYLIACDAGYIISWEQMRKQTIVMENFLLKNKNLYECRELMHRMEARLYGYLHGADNTPLIYYTTKKLDKDIIKSYKNFIKYNKKSKFYYFIKKLYELYQENDFKQNKKIELHLKSFNIYNLLWKQ